MIDFIYAIMLICGVASLHAISVLFIYLIIFGTDHVDSGDQLLACLVISSLIGIAFEVYLAFLIFGGAAI